ncbi:uncharacterized protein METZ01_LOCUS480442, partial [marine metagenome]
PVERSVGGGGALRHPPGLSDAQRADRVGPVLLPGRLWGRGDAVGGRAGAVPVTGSGGRLHRQGGAAGRAGARTGQAAGDGVALGRAPAGDQRAPVAGGRSRRCRGRRGAGGGVVAEARFEPGTGAGVFRGRRRGLHDGDAGRRGVGGHPPELLRGV